MLLQRQGIGQAHIRRLFVYLVLLVFILLGNYEIFDVTIYSISLSLVSVVVLLDIFYRNVNKITYDTATVEKYKIACILSLLNIIFVCLLNSFQNGNRIFLIGTNILTSFAVSMYFRDSRSIRRLLKLYVVLVTISSLVVIGQYFNVSLAYNIINFTQAGTASTFEISVEDSRFYGLAKDTLHFGYQCSTAIILLLFLKKEKNSSIEVFLKVVSMIILFAALLFCRTRVSEIVVLLGIIVKVLNSIADSSPFKKILIVICVVASLLVGSTIFELQFMQNALRSSEINATGTTSRIPMLLTALNHALHHPLGMGDYEVDPSLVVGISTSRQFTYVTQYTAHNLIGNCAACYGFQGLFLMACIYKYVWRGYKELKSKIVFNYDLLIAIIFGIFGLFVNALAHNNYIFSGDLTSWILFGALFGLCNNAAENEGSKEEEFL